ncbi:MAG: C1 family peptidase [Bacteriovorax sp.]|nr:C1 family peptidase [Bacteriovorax sp.]
MKKISFALLAIACITQSCGPKKVVNGSTFKHKMVLSAFVDLNNPSTIDEKELAGLPRIVDLKNDMTPVKNQGNRGTCTFFTVMAIVEASIKKDLQLETNLSEEYLNYKTKSAGFFADDEGSNVGYNLIVLKKNGILVESDWAYQPSWFVKSLPCSQFKSTDAAAPKNCFSHNRPTDNIMKKVINADGFEVINVPSNTNEVIKFLAIEKRPLSFGLIVNENGWPESGDIFYNDALREECLKTPEACGGHAVTITGYDMDKKIFFFKNSWGEEWGHEGYGTLTFDTLDRFSSGQYMSVKLNGTLALPKGSVVDNLSLKNFSVKSKLESDQSLSIKATGKVQGATGHFLFVSSYLVKQPGTSLEDPSDKNVEIVSLSTENTLKFNETVVRSMLYFSPESHKDNLIWDANTPINLDISTEMMNVPEVTDLLSSATNKSFLRTTIYYFSDTGFKVLKRIYHPVDQK